MTILTNHLIADVSRLSMVQIISRIAILIIALGLNCILPSPITILFVTVFTVMMLVWQIVGLMSDDAAVLDSALYFVYLIITVVGECMQMEELEKENRRLTQENGELMREKEQLQRTTPLANVYLPSIKLTVIVLILAVTGCALAIW